MYYWYYKYDSDSRSSNPGMPSALCSHFLKSTLFFCNQVALGPDHRLSARHTYVMYWYVW